jgi:MFS family permease
MLAAVSGYAMDGFDLLILGFMLPAISISLALDPSQAGSLVTWTLIGAVIGGIVFGQLSDRFGRIRILAGVGLGGEFGIGMALISDTFPPQARATAQNVLFNLGRGIGGFGPVVIGLLASKFSFVAAITLLALIYLLDILATLFLLPKKQSKEDALGAIG